MINRIMERGGSTGGLVRYLAGPGRANEHRGQRVIAAAATLGIADGARLDPVADRAKVAELGRQLDSHRRAYGIEVTGGHVWHCAISLPPEERLSDTQWAQVARAAGEAMGFTGTSGKAPCRWVAIHHGPSGGGNDHIHLAVNLVREDGTTASIWRERRTMSRLCAAMEHRFGLSVVYGRAGRGLPGYTRAEAERARRLHRVEPDRRDLARLVRDAATAAPSEAEWLRRLRGVGVLVRPRHAADGRGVSGYAVALPGPSTPIWYGGCRLAADLTLPALRAHWASQAPRTDHVFARNQALSEWATPDQPKASPAAGSCSRARWNSAAAQVGQARELLTASPPGDTAAYATAARYAAGICAGLSHRLEATPGPLAAATDALAHSAQTRPRQPRRAHHRHLAALRHAAAVAGYADRRRPDPWIPLLRALIAIIGLIADQHLANQQHRHAARLRTIADQHLAALARPTAALRTAVDFPTALPARPAIPPTIAGSQKRSPASPNRSRPSRTRRQR